MQRNNSSLPRIKKQTSGTNRSITSHYNDGTPEHGNSSSGIHPEHSFLSVIKGTGVSISNTLEKNMESQFGDIITNFVSKRIKEICGNTYRAASNNADENGSQKVPALRPGVSSSFGAVVMVDVSGYSKLTSSLAERGPVGAEILSKTMKGYLDGIIAVILSHGGDIIKFVGDAVIVCWSSVTATDLSNTDQDIERGELVYKASYCCLQLLTKLGEYNINIPDSPAKVLRIHLGIGAGIMYDIVCGGPPGRFEHFLAGDPVDQLSQVLDIAKAGELALSHQALKWLVWVVDVRTLNLGDYDKRCIILNGLSQAQRRVPVPEVVVEPPKEMSDTEKQAVVAMYREFMDQTALFKLQCDINQANLFQLQSGLEDLLDLVELRQITTIFIKIIDLHGDSEELLAHSQAALNCVQMALHKWDGSLRQFHVDDKGAVILCFFGLPPLAHENDSKLGVSAGIEIRDKFIDLFDDFSIGITTGVVSFGGVGAIGRAEYAVMGDAINMAARLMCHKEARNAILCDEKTYNLCEGDFQFEPLGEAVVKGKSHPILIFRPGYSTIEGDNDATVGVSTNSDKFFGREAEKLAFQEILQELKYSEEVKNFFVGAEGGLGLTTFATWCKAQAIQDGCYVCSGKATQMEENTSFYIFRNLVFELVLLLDVAIIAKDKSYILPGEGSSRKKPFSLSSPIEESSVGSAENIDGRRSLFPPNLDPIGVKNLNSNIGHRKSESLNLPLPLSPSTDIANVGELMPSSTKPNDRKLVRKMSRLQGLQIAEINHNSNKQVAEGHSRKASNTPKYMSNERANDSEEEMMNRFEGGLRKFECSDKQIALLRLLTSTPDDESEVLTQAHLKLHAKDILDILTKILCALANRNKILLHITEAHYTDSLSWDLLLELAVSCPRVSILCFNRPANTFERKEHKRIYRLITQLPRTKMITLMGLTAEETNSLIMATWRSHVIKRIDPKISESIFRRTDGNPFFIQSLVLALKESGQWRIGPNGDLTTPDPKFDFDKLVLGYDTQNIVLAQFDKLDRNFQMFLKIASVLGMKFALDDVIYFITGFADMYEHVEKTQYQTIVNSVEVADKYQFLIKDAGSYEGAYFQFKSALVQKCVYSMMVVNQRQQLHLLVARYLEKKMNEQNRHRYVVPILENYMNTSKSHKLKRIQYSEIAAQFFFEKEEYPETIKYCKQLLDLTQQVLSKELQSLSTLNLANFHRELGYSLMIMQEFEEAKEHLIISLALMNIKIPPKGLRFKLALRKQLKIRQKMDKEYFKDRPPSHEEDYTQSYVAKKGASGYSLGILPNIGQGKNRSKDELSTSEGGSNNALKAGITVSLGQQVIRDTRESILGGQQHALVTLAEVLLNMGDFEGHLYAVLVGLNIANTDSIENHMSKLYSLGAIAHKHLSNKNDSELSMQYTDAAMTYDLRTDIHISLMQVTCSSIILFLRGQLEATLNKLEVVLYLSNMAGEISNKIEGLSTKAMIQGISTTRELALKTARDLRSFSQQREVQLGIFWGCFHILNSLIGSAKDKDEILELTQEILNIWDSVPKTRKNIIHVQLAKDSMLLLINVLYNFQVNTTELLLSLINLTSSVSFTEWQVLPGFTTLGVALFKLIQEHSEKDDAELIKLVIHLCTNASNCLKTIKSLGQLGYAVQRIFKGINLQARNRTKDALKTWKKGLETNSEDIYVQAVLNSIIGTVSNDSSYFDKAEENISDLKSRQKFMFIFPPI